jgi:RND family efflux transporter MFP subunit
MQKPLEHREIDGARLWRQTLEIARSVRPLYLMAAALAIAAAIWSWRAFRGPEVTFVAPARGTAVEIVYATGAVEPVRWAKVASVIRDRIVEICDCEGKAVTKNEVLARLDDKEQRALLEELRAREEFAKKELSRQADLVDRGITTPQAHEKVSMELRTVQALILAQMEKLDDRTITAPIDGVVLRRDGEVGEIAEAGQVLFRIGVLRPLQVVAEVNEEDILRVAVGQTVLLRTDAFSGQRLEGTVREITPMGDPVAKTYRIKVALPDDTPLKPGMSLEANVITREKPGALLVPADAVQGTTVYAVEGSRLKKRPVEIGIRGTRAVEILSGVTENDRVVSPAVTGLADGLRVRATKRLETVP